MSCQVALSLETYGLTVDAQQMYLDLIAREQSGAGTAHVSQDELETWEVSWADLLLPPQYVRVCLNRSFQTPLNDSGYYRRLGKSSYASGLKYRLVCCSP